MIIPHFNLCFFSLKALKSEWEREAEHTQSALQTSLLDYQNRLTSTQKELDSTQASIIKTNITLTEAQEALARTQSELQDSKARLDKLQTSSEEQSQNLEDELKQALADRDAAARELQSSTVLQGLLPKNSDCILQTIKSLVKKLNIFTVFKSVFNASKYE